MSCVPAATAIRKSTAHVTQKKSGAWKPGNMGSLPGSVRVNATPRNSTPTISCMVIVQARLVQ